MIQRSQVIGFIVSHLEAPNVLLSAENLAHAAALLHRASRQERRDACAQLLIYAGRFHERDCPQTSRQLLGLLIQTLGAEVGSEMMRAGGWPLDEIAKVLTAVPATLQGGLKVPQKTGAFIHSKRKL